MRRRVENAGTDILHIHHSALTSRLPLLCLTKKIDNIAKLMYILFETQCTTNERKAFGKVLKLEFIDGQEVFVICR